MCDLWTILISRMLVYALRWVDGRTNGMSEEDPFSYVSSSSIASTIVRAAHSEWESECNRPITRHAENPEDIWLMTHRHTARVVSDSLQRCSRDQRQDPMILADDGSPLIFTLMLLGRMFRSDSRSVVYLVTCIARSTLRQHTCRS